VSTWHQVIGESGEPVVLLHGAFAGASSWSAQAPALAANGWRVHLPERRGHAHTPDVPGPFTYSVMADDTCAYLETVIGGPAHLVGWSDGAVVGLLTALRRPDLVRRLVLIGQYYNSAGRSAAGSDLERMLQSSDAVSFLRGGYDPISPDGAEHFDVVYGKTIAMVRTEPEIALSELSSVTNHTLVLQGDRDIATLEHAAAVVAGLPHGRLAVLPGTHALPIESADLVNSLLTRFLADSGQT
jgi:pimeloyl-ACP methyl ester carboxylesterase